MSTLRPRLSSFAIVLALLLASFAFQPGVRAGDKESPGASGFALYSSNFEGPYIELDPETLADVEGHGLSDVIGMTPDVLLSADGSTMVEIEHGNQTTIVISDGIDGRERLRFEPGRPVSGQAISQDGSRVVTVNWGMACDPSDCTAPEWSVFDTADGRQISRFKGSDQGYGPIARVDASAERLYQLTYLQEDEPEGPWPIEIVAFDLTSGTGAGRLAVPGLRGGNWWTRSVQGVLIGDQLMPALAISPDGDRLAMVGAETDRLITIDTATMTVANTQALVHSASVGQRVLGWLGIAPQTASAKLTAGRWLHATFAPDGEHLYLWGMQTEIGDTMEDSEYRGLGLQLIDVTTGEIVTEALDGMVVESVVPAPDNETVYVSGMEAPRDGYYSGATHLWRLESGTLETLAERQLNYTGRLAVVPLPLPVEVQ